MKLPVSKIRNKYLRRLTIVVSFPFVCAYCALMTWILATIEWILRLVAGVVVIPVRRYREARIHW